MHQQYFWPFPFARGVSRYATYYREGEKRVRNSTEFYDDKDIYFPITSTCLWSKLVSLNYGSFYMFCFHRKPLEWWNALLNPILSRPFSFYRAPSLLAFSHIYFVFSTTEKERRKGKKEKKSLHFSFLPPRGKDTVFFSVISEEEKKTVSQQQLRSSGHRKREKTKLIFFLRVGNQCVRVANYHAPPLRFPSIFRTCVSSLAPLFLPPSDSRKKGRISVLCLVS